MQEETKQKIISALKSATPLVGLLGLAYLLKSKEDKMRVHFLDVGDGHCTHIHFPNGEDMLIDLYQSGTGTDIIQHLKRHGIGSIEYLVITHPHIDHFRGITELYSNFKLGEVWCVDCQYFPSKYRSEDDRIEFKNYYEILRRNGVTKHNDDRNYIDDVFIRILNPMESPNNEQVNNLSLVLFVQYGEFRMIIPGDNLSENWEEIAERWKIAELDILLASHHGQKSGYNNEFMKKASPIHLVFSSGSKKDYDGYDNYYPHAQNIHTTRNDGDIAFDCYSDGTCEKI